MERKALYIAENESIPPYHADLNVNLIIFAATYYFSQAQYVQAEQILKSGLAMQEKALGPDHPDVAKILNALGDLYYKQRQYEKVEPLLKQALAIQEKALGSDHPDVALSLNNLAELYREQHQYEKAKPLYQRSLAILEKADPNHPYVILFLDNFGTYYYEQGQYEKAEPLYQRSLAIREKALGPDHPEVATSLNVVAMLYHKQGQYEKAEPLYQRSLAIREKALGLNHPDTSISLNNLAELYSSLGQYEKAEPLYKRALAIREKALGPEHPDVATSLNNLGGLYYALGQYEKVEPLYKRALAIQEKALGPEHPNVATSLNNLAELYSSLGQYEKAEPLYKRALAIREKALSPDHPDLIVSLSNLASYYADQGQYLEAASLNERLMEVSEMVLGENHSDMAKVWDNLGSFYDGRGFKALAEPLYKRSLTIREKALGPDHPDVALSLNNIARIYDSRGLYALAEPLYQRSLTILEKALGPDHPNVAKSLINQTENVWARGEMVRAIEMGRRANAIRERHLRLLLANGSEYEKRAYMATIKSDVDIAISLDLAVKTQGLDSSRLALTTLLQRKGRVLDALADSFGDLRRRLSPEDTVLLDQLSSVNAQRAQMYTRATQAKVMPEQYERQMASLEAEAQALEGRISASSAEFRALAQPITLEGIQQLIPAGAALVEFSVYQSLNPQAKTQEEKWGSLRYVAYVLRSDGDPIAVDLGEARSIELIVANLRKGLGDPDSYYVKRMGRKLDEQVMRPIRKLLGKTQTVLLSPDGELNLVPFGALVDEEDQYLIKSYAFTYLSSGRDLLRLQTAIPSQSPGTVMANVDYGPTAKVMQLPPTGLDAARRRSTDFAVGGFLPASPLPGTAAEAQAIGRILPAIKVLNGKQATESALKQLNSPRILHVATHGFFLPISREEPLEESPFQPGVSSMRAPKTENPLLRSGLLLANANRLESGGEDGVLTALEAAGLDLWGTKLVVLSACETSLGEVKNGEGVFGLRRALVIAGSESQVMSLWKVDDLATKDLMADYYRNLRANGGRSEALRQAQLTMLGNENRDHPFYWAGFIPSGNWIPVGK